MKKLCLLLAALLLAPAALAQTTVPFVFTPGQTARAADVNADFQALATAIDALVSRVNKLEGQFGVADMRGGVFAMHRMAVGYGNSPVTNHDSYTGTMTLNADGTFVMLQNDTFYTNNVPAGSSAVNKAVTTGVSYPGTWTMAGTVVTFNFAAGKTITANCVSGGRLCVSSITTDSSGTVELGMFLRTN